MRAPSLWKSSIVLKAGFFLLFVLAGRSVFGSVSLGVSPPFLEVQLAFGVSRNSSAEVTNTGDEDISVRCFLADLSLSPQGDVLLVPLGSTSLSLLPCIILRDEGVFTLRPKEVKQVIFRLKIPPEVQGGRYGAIVFEALPVVQRDITIGVRTGVLLFLVPRTRREVRVSVDVQEEGEKLLLSVQNGGNVHVRVRGESLVRTKEGRLLRRIPFPEEGSFLLLPQGVRELEVAWQSGKAFPPGEYRVEVRVFEEDRRRVHPLDSEEILVSLPSNS